MEGGTRSFRCSYFWSRKAASGTQPSFLAMGHTCVLQVCAGRRQTCASYQAGRTFDGGRHTFVEVLVRLVARCTQLIFWHCAKCACTR